MAQTGREPEPSGILEHLWERQRGWSVGADEAKTRVERARTSNLVLIVGAALLGALAAQSAWLSSTPQRAASLAAALLLLVAGFIQSEYLTASKVKAWTGARGASETLKAMAYSHLAGVELDNSPDRTGVESDLLNRLTAVESRAFALGAAYGEPDGKSLPDIAGIAEYRTRRAEEQGRWHAARYEDHHRQARRLRAGQLVLTAAGSFLAFLAGIASLPSIYAWVAAVAAMGAAVSAHISASQHDRIAESYQITASMLEREVVRYDSMQQGDDVDLKKLDRSLVQRTEEILARQNDSWIDMIQSAAE